MRHTDFVNADSPVVARSYVSGVIAGRLVGGDGGTVALRDWRWLRGWEGVGGEGSVYDLIQSDVVPSRRGPLTHEVGIFQQADIQVVSEAVYRRLTA